MSEACHAHATHDHVHGPGCGHTAIRWSDHVDYVHDGHLHHAHGEHWDEDVIPVSAAHPADCQPLACTAHDTAAIAVPHGDHVDHLVNGRLHHHHEGHCDDHGAVELV